MTQEKTTNKGMRTFYTIWFGQLVSTLGSGLTGFALGVWIYETSGSVTMFALNTFFYMGASLVVAPFAGALVDRYNRRLIMILSDAGAGLTTVAIWMLLLTGKMEPWHIYIVSIFNAAFTSFQFPAHESATTMIVPKDQLGRAGGMVQIGQAISQLFSPALAGYLYLEIGLKSIVLIDFATFGVAVLSLLMAHIPEPERSTEGKKGQGSLFKEIAFGWRYITERKGLYYYMLYIAGLNASFGVFTTLLTPLMLELGDAQQMGFVSSFIGAGMLLGTVVMSIWGGPKRRMFAVLGSGFFTGFCVIALGAQPSLTLIGISGFLMMISVPIFNGNSRAMWQTKVAPDIQGRVFSVRRVIGQFTFPISALISGPLVDNVFQPMMNESGLLASSVGKIIGIGPGRGTALAFVTTGLLVVISTAIAFAHPRIRRLEIEIPDAEVIEKGSEEQKVREAVPSSTD